MGKISIYEDRSEEIILKYNTIATHEFKYLSEGIISDAWQSWCCFCRSVIHYSCNGATRRNGTVIQKRNTLNSWQRIGYEAAHAASPRIKPNGVLTHIRNEPTWGDISKIIDIINTLNPNNKSQLNTAFGLPIFGPKHMQIIRNACQHKNQETMTEARRVYSYYSARTNNPPSFIIREIDNSKTSFVIHSWLDDIKIIAENSTS